MQLTPWLAALAAVSCSPTGAIPGAVTGPRVLWDEDPDAPLPCPADARDGALCDRDATGWAEPYDSFFAQPEAQAAASPWPDCSAELDRMGAARLESREWAETLDWEDGLSPRTLGRAAWAGVHMEFLLDDVQGRELRATVVAEERFADRVEQRVILQDRFAGRVPLLLVLPVSGGPHPAVVVHPGHAEDGAFHYRFRFGGRLVEAGFAFAAVDFRAYRQDDPRGRRPEHDAAMRFFCAGQSLTTMRAYEGLLAQRAVAAHPAVDGSRIGVLGHSGGSSTAHLSMWLPEAPARAWVVDSPPSHADFDPPEGPPPPDADPADYPPPSTWSLDCGVHSALQGLSGPLSEVCALPPEWDRAVRRVPYGYDPDLQPLEPPPDDCRMWPFGGGNSDPDPESERPAQWFVPFFEDQLGG